ncbi:T9SS-dependent M36 family metallopeptidase [Lacinutrix salivirga]
MKKYYTFLLSVFSMLFFINIGNSQSSLSESQYGSIIEAYINKNKVKLNVTPSDISDLIVEKEFLTKKTGVTHVYVNQRHQGIKIFNATSSVAVKNNSVFYIANRFLNNISQKVTTSTPVISAELAIQKGASHFNLGNTQNLELLETSHNKYVYSNGEISKNDIPVELSYFLTTDGDLKLAWDLNIHSTSSQNWWSIRVDAVSGDILSFNDWIVSCNFGDDHSKHNHQSIQSQTETFNLFKQQNSSLLVDGSQYNVIPLPNQSPDEGPAELISEPANSIASPFGWHDVDGVAGAEFTITRGNNVWAQEDANGNDGVGFSPDGTSSLNFNFPLDDNQAPISFQQASLTNLFYMNNMMHDIWYAYGFDEASGNFQSNNYGNGGNDGDFVFADGQDGSGLNNATFGTPPDGLSPGMTMFLWAASGPPGQPLTINNSTAAGDYTATTANFGSPLTTTPITADLALVVDNNAGTSVDANDACDPITNAPNLMGKIAVLNRGECEFGFKVLAAENAGAIAVIVINNTFGDPIAMAGGAVGDQVTIPSIMINITDGQSILNALNNGQTVNATLIASGPFQKDGSLDNVIVGHEYGHGISNRLTGGALNANCLTACTAADAEGNCTNWTEQMGEGWSDWFALMITMKATDVGTDGRGVATYSVSQGLDGLGIRSKKYSTDTTINDFTYGDTNSPNLRFSHGIGSVWATMLWDLTWAYVDKYGFDPDFYNGTGGNNKVMQLVLDGLKLQPCNPGFVDGRDALLAADTATGGEDQCLIWEVFAARGLGVNAVQGSSLSVLDQVENFDVPPSTDPTLANCTSLSVDEFSISDFQVYPNPANNIVNIKTSKNFGEVVITLTDLNGRQVISTKANLIDEVSIDINQLQSGLYILSIEGDAINSNTKIIKN